MNKIAIIEDDIDICNMIAKFLENNKYIVHYALNGAEGIELCKSLVPDLIILDIMLPRLNGNDVLQRLRKFTNAPVIVVSAKTMVQTKIDLLKLGADDYMTKPFDLHELLARIEANLKRTSNTSLSNKYIEELAYAINQKDTLHKKLQVQIKQEEEQLKQSISNISHDLRTPLTSIQGYLTLLQECENKQEQEQYLKIIKAKTDYLTELVQYFYDLSVLENEQSDVECERIDINRIVTDCLIEKYYEFGEIQPIIQTENCLDWLTCFRSGRCGRAFDFLHFFRTRL